MLSLYLLSMSLIFKKGLCQLHTQVLVLNWWIIIRITQTILLEWILVLNWDMGMHVLMDDHYQLTMEIFQLAPSQLGFGSFFKKEGLLIRQFSVFMIQQIMWWILNWYFMIKLCVFDQAPHGQIQQHFQIWLKDGLVLPFRMLNQLILLFMFGDN